MVNNNSKNIIFTSAIFAILTIVFVCGYFVYQNVGFVHSYFSPQTTSFFSVEKETVEWESIQFDSQDSIAFDGPFWDKAVVNDANSAGDVLVRVKDEKGNIVIDKFQISPGMERTLDNLKKDTNYYFEVKTTAKGQFIINAI